MLAIDLIRNFQNLLNERPGGFDLSKESVLKILESYEDELGSDTFGEEGNLIRVQSYYNGISETKKQIHEINLEVYRTTNVAGVTAMRSVFIINGGAAVAVSAFIGTITASSSLSSKLEPLSLSLACFALGAFAVSISFGAAYLTHFLAGYPEERKFWKDFVSNCFNGLALLGGISGLVLFAFGLFKAYSALS